MSGVRLDVALAVLAASVALLGVRRARGVVTPPRVPAPVIAQAPSAPPVDDPDSLDAAVDMVVDHDPFRLSNRPPSPTAATSPLLPGRPTAPPRIRPVLVLKAIIGGPPWQAIIAGLPGQSGDAVVSAGSTFDVLQVRAVTRDSVIVTGADTTWTLRLQRGR